MFLDDRVRGNDINFTDVGDNYEIIDIFVDTDSMRKMFSGQRNVVRFRGLKNVHRLDFNGKSSA